MMQAKIDMSMQEKSARQVHKFTTTEAAQQTGVYGTGTQCRQVEVWVTRRRMPGMT